MYILLVVVCPFVLFLLDIVLSVLLRYTEYDCPFGIFKIFFQINFSKFSINVGDIGKIKLEAEQYHIDEAIPYVD
jgi:hypothetical protein